MTPSDFADDADLTHRWATDHRLPLVSSTYPRWRYHVALVVPSYAEGTDTSDPALVEKMRYDLDKATWPDDSEAEVLASYQEHMLDYYNVSYRARMTERPLDVDSSVNTIIFVKQEKGWRFRRSSFTDGGLYPGYNDEQFSPDRDGLVALIWQIGKHGTFPEFAAQRPEIWGEDPYAVEREAERVEREARYAANQERRAAERSTRLGI